MTKARQSCEPTPLSKATNSPNVPAAVLFIDRPPLKFPQVVNLGLIRLRGHNPKGGYDVHNVRYDTEAKPAELY